ncbi:hypothetical protein HN784_01420 [bacterium]|jgi:hypothetical protein|nr:hypothetical protein [bacterium]MBT4250926.1 hypothetical protein [bacterium]MBT4597886.1 hypothetical protein [bacterium]MBT6753922.1 hypothetical protein [bacterium]MBT7037351.1 hypothetical protein [bacterium]
MKKNIKKIASTFFLLSILTSPLLVSAQFIVEEEREVPSTFAQQGLKTLNTTIGAINIFLGIFFLVSIIGLIVAGIRFIIAGGSESMLNSARKISIASVVGIISSLIGYLLINTIKHFII